MTTEEKYEAIQQYCNDHDCSIAPCKLEGYCEQLKSGTLDSARVDIAYERICPTVDQTDPTEEQPHDVVHRPSHYCREGAMECIDEMVLLFGREAVKHFALCNIWKYRYRSADKNGKEDISKSDEYVQIYKRLCEDEQAQGF